MRPAFRAPYDTANAASVPVSRAADRIGGPAYPATYPLTGWPGQNNSSFEVNLGGRLTGQPPAGLALSRRAGPNIAAENGRGAVRVRPGRGLGAGQLPAGPLVQGDGRVAVGNDFQDRLKAVSGRPIGGGPQQRLGQAPVPGPAARRGL
jgi:hypothetical protein